MAATFRVLALLALLVWSASAWSQKPIAYPAKGQSSQQQANDDAQCLSWATQTTGIDPVAVASASPPPSGPRGERARGALRGAAGGALIGEVADDDASHGAAVGATAGVLAGGARARRNRAAEAEKADASKAQALDRYYNAYTACMEGRGYTVN